MYSQWLIWRDVKASVFHSRFVPTGRMLLKANPPARLKDQLDLPGDCRGFFFLDSVFLLNFFMFIFPLQERILI